MSNENSQATTAPEVVIDSEASVEDMAMSVRAIEGLFHSIDVASFPLRCYQDVMTGMQFLKAVHDGIVKKLGPEEVAKIRQSEAFKAQAKVSVEPVAAGH